MPVKMAAELGGHLLKRSSQNVGYNKIKRSGRPEFPVGKSRCGDGVNAGIGLIQSNILFRNMNCDWINVGCQYSYW